MKLPRPRRPALRVRRVRLTTAEALSQARRLRELDGLIRDMAETADVLLIQERFGELAPLAAELADLASLRVQLRRGL